MNPVTRCAELGIGTATFLPGYGLRNSDRPGVGLLQRALDLGIRYLDTAAAYGDSEIAIGELATEIRDRGVRVCTKVPYADMSPGAIEGLTRKSLARLRASSVDTLLIHSPSGAVLRSLLTSDAWQSVRMNGLAKRTGASTYGTDDAALALASQFCSAVQVEYSILNQSVIRRLAAHKRPGQEVVVRSVLCKGLLTMAAEGRSLATEITVVLNALADLAGSWNMSLSTLGIRFALDTPGIDIVLVGVASPEELNEAINAWHRAPLNPTQWVEAASFDRSGSGWVHPERWPEGRPVA